MSDVTIKSPLLTEREAIAWLRLDGDDGPKNPAGTLKFYRGRGLLHGVKIGRRMRYSIWALQNFVRQLEERNGGDA